MAFSQKLLQSVEAKYPHALERIELAKARIQSILDRERVAHQKTLEQKISDQGPQGTRVDPHLLGLAIMDLKEQNRLKASQHPSTNAQPWYSNVLTSQAEIDDRLNTLAPLYAETLSFSNHIGDALEVITEKAIANSFHGKARYSYQGHFLHGKERDKQGRIKKIQPPKAVSDNESKKEADFLLFGFDAGPICVECKNYREWFYPRHGEIKSTIIKSYELGCIPLFIGRRIHYTAKENLCGPSGILYHESFYQYYDPLAEAIAIRAKDKTLLGFTDIRASHDPDKRTMSFFSEYLPKLLDQAAPLWEKHRHSAYAYAKDQMNLAQLYNEIGSPAGGKWVNPGEEEIPF